MHACTLYMRIHHDRQVSVGRPVVEAHLLHGISSQTYAIHNLARVHRFTMTHNDTQWHTHVLLYTQAYGGWAMDVIANSYCAALFLSPADPHALGDAAAFYQLHTNDFATTKVCYMREYTVSGAGFLSFGVCQRDASLSVQRICIEIRIGCTLHRNAHTWHMPPSMNAFRNVRKSVRS